MRKVLVFASVLLLFVACSNEAKEEENKESVIFRSIDIVLEGDEVLITGEVNTWDGNLYYHVLAGEEKIIDEALIHTNHINFWWEFDISLSKEELLSLTDGVPHIVLYGKNSSDEDINPNYVPIDLE